MNRRWEAGKLLVVDGVHYRVQPGRKGPRDLRLEHYVGNLWRPVAMRHGAVLADFFYENEETLYPPPAKGGQYYLNYLRDATRCGWEKADATLRVERFQREAQGSLLDELTRAAYYDS